MPCLAAFFCHKDIQGLVAVDVSAAASRPSWMGTPSGFLGFDGRAGVAGVAGVADDGRLNPTVAGDHNWVAELKTGKAD